jgi:predicted small secreted protein
MKNIVSYLLFSTLLVLSACNTTETAEKEVQNTDELRTSSQVTGNASSTSTAAASGAVVNHYICASNCAGSGGPSAGNCPVCGKEYLHNDAFHAQDNQAQPEMILGDQNGAVTPPPAAEPPQNANGVWHYTCASGCAGGSGAAVACPSCGATLQHNAAYHM